MWLTIEENKNSNEAILEMDTMMSLMPGDDEDDGSDDDWTDIDDEDFEDMAEDADDFHEMQLENDLLDTEDEDHLPDDDME